MQQTKAQTGAEYIICIMSASFVQRGEPAIMDKFTRCRAALAAGADMVLELPVIYSLQSAEFFAKGAVATLDALNAVTHLSFGSEHGQIEELENAAKLELDPAVLKAHSKKGLSHPVALFAALEDKKDAHLLATPNNLLGIEYIKAINSINSNITPITIQRIGAGHDSQENSAYPSASKLRALWKANGLESIKPYLPREVLSIFDAAKDNALVDDNKLYTFLMYNLATATPAILAQMAGVAEGIEYKFKEEFATAKSLDELVLSCKSKRYTYARLSRALCCILLGITKEFCQRYQRPAYVRVLGLKERAKPLLSLISRRSSLPVITSCARFLDTATENAAALLNMEMRATDLYNLALPHPLPPGQDLTSKLIVMP